MDVSIIIVNYNTKKLLTDCINSIINMTFDISYEIIVSDNGSCDGSVEYVKRTFPNVIVIENNDNLGFGKANNAALSKASGKYILYLNSDTILLNNAVKIFYDYWEQNESYEQIGALGCNLENKNGDILISSAVFPTEKNELKYLIHCFLSSLYIKKIFYKIAKKKEFNKTVGEVDFLIGADLFLLNNNAARFDERFFMYYEESDLQLQLLKEGKKRLLIDGPRIIHFEGGSSDENRMVYKFNKLTSCYYWISCLKYIKKNIPQSTKYKLIKNLLLIIYLFPWNCKYFNYIRTEIKHI